MESAEFGSYITNAYGLLKMIFSYLDGADLMVASRVCREWYEVASRMLHDSNYIRSYARKGKGRWEKVDCLMAPCAAVAFNMSRPNHSEPLSLLKKHYDMTKIPLVSVEGFRSIFYEPEKQGMYDVKDFLLMFPQLPGVNIKFIYSGSSTLLSYVVEHEPGKPGAVHHKLREHTCYDCMPTKLSEEPLAKRLKKEPPCAKNVAPYLVFRSKRGCYSGPNLQVPFSPPPDLAESKGVILIITRKSPEPPSFFLETNIRLAGGVTTALYINDPLGSKEYGMDMFGISFYGDNVETHSGIHHLHTEYNDFLKNLAEETGPLPEGSRRIAFMFTCVNRGVLFPDERLLFSEHFPNVPVYGFRSLGEFHLAPESLKQRVKRNKYYYQQCTSFLIVTYKMPRSST